MKSPSIRFYCIKQKKNSDSDCRLIISVSWDGNRLIYYPGIILKDYQWDTQRSEFRNIRNKDALNSGLISLRRKLIDLHRSLWIRYGNVTKRHYRNELNKISIDPGYSLTGAFIKFMEENEANWSKNTFLKCKSFYPKLDHFSRYYGSFVSLEAVDKDFMNSFHEFLMREGLNFSSRYSYMNLFKWFLNWAKNNAMIINDEYKDFSLSKTEAESCNDLPSLHLNWEELLNLFFSKPESRKLEHCRDIYCLMAFTGCQFDELHDLKKTDIEDGMLLISGRNCRKVPMNRYSQEIINRYHNKYYRGGSLMPAYAKMSLNKYIRELCVFLKFERKIIVRRRGMVLDSTIQELITINSAKWTFYANAVKLGIPADIVTKWSGMKSLKLYNRVKKDLDIMEKQSIALINGNYENTF